MAFTYLHSNWRWGRHICKCMQTSCNLASPGRTPVEIIPYTAVHTNLPVTQRIWLAIPCWNLYHWNLIITDIATRETVAHLISPKSYLGSVAFLKCLEAWFCSIKAQPAWFQESQVGIWNNIDMQQILFKPTQGELRNVCVATLWRQSCNKFCPFVTQASEQSIVIRVYEWVHYMYILYAIDILDKWRIQSIWTHLM